MTRDRESGTRRMIDCPPDRPELDALLKNAAKHKMTREEIAAQRKSWVIGEMLLDHPEMSREDAEWIYDEATK